MVLKKVIQPKERSHWRKLRQYWEIQGLRSYPLDSSTQKRFDLFGLVMGLISKPLKLTGLLNFFSKNTYTIHLHQQVFKFANLPQALDGLKILHLSDLHLDESGMDLEQFKRTLPDEYDFVVFTGDYFSARPVSHGKAEKMLEDILYLLKPKYEILAVLGNHDHSSMVDWFELRQVTVLTNQIMTFQIGQDFLSFAGTDDPHYFYTDHASEILKTKMEHFSVALVHSPELFDCASSGDHQLYLCGHTHAGQIALAPGVPIVKRVLRGRHLIQGPWRHGKMQGYTHSGMGTTTLPLRINTKAEIALHELVCDQAAPSE